MVLNPQDIHNKEFSVKMRGYNIDQVNDFLDRIVKDYQITLSENQSLKKSLNEAQSQLKYFNNLKNSLNQSILVAQEAADKVKTDSQKQSEEINQKAQKEAQDVLDDSHQKADKIINNATDRANKLITETNDLKKTTKSFQRKVKVMLESQLELINSDKWDQLFDDKNSDNYQKVEQQIQNLDNYQSSSVESLSNESDLVSSTLIYYPDGTSKTVE